MCSESVVVVCSDRAGHPAFPVRLMGNAVPAAEAGGGGTVPSAPC